MIKKKAPCLATGRFEMSYFLLYQDLVPWHAGEQELAVALKFKEAMVFVTPFMCVAAVTAVEL
jgi:hypothetical protein